MKSLHSFLNELDERAKKAGKRVEELLRKNSPEVTDIDRMRLDVFLAETERRLIELKNGMELAKKTLGVLHQKSRRRESLDEADRGGRLDSLLGVVLVGGLARQAIANSGAAFPHQFNMVIIY